MKSSSETICVLAVAASGEDVGDGAEGGPGSSEADIARSPDLYVTTRNHAHSEMLAVRNQMSCNERIFMRSAY